MRSAKDSSQRHSNILHSNNGASNKFIGGALLRSSNNGSAAADHGSNFEHEDSNGLSQHGGAAASSSSSNGLSRIISAASDLFDGGDAEAAALFETEDQHANFVPLEPPLGDEDYLFSLDMGEGISDLFDAYDLTF